MFKNLRSIFGIKKKESILLGSNKNTDTFGFSKVLNKNLLLKQIIQNVPNDSIWHLDGIHTKTTFETIKPYIIGDSNFPKQDEFKVLLNENAKIDVCSNLGSWDLELKPIHQHIFKGDKYYLESYDNLHRSCTWISLDLRNMLKDINQIIVIAE